MINDIIKNKSPPYSNLFLELNSNEAHTLNYSSIFNLYKSNFIIYRFTRIQK